MAQDIDLALVDKIVPSRRAAQAAMVKVKEQQQPARTGKPNEVQSSGLRSSEDVPLPLSPLSSETSKSDEQSAHEPAVSHPLQSSTKLSKQTSKVVKKSKSLQHIRTDTTSQNAKSLRTLSPLSDASSEAQTHTNKRKGGKSSGTPIRKRAKLKASASETRIQDLIRPSESSPFVTKPAQTWSLEKLGEFVYVRLGRGGVVTPSGDTFDRPPGYWWPAKVSAASIFKHPMF